MQREHLLPKVSKTKLLIVDFRKKESNTHTSDYISGTGGAGEQFK